MKIKNNGFSNCVQILAIKFCENHAKTVSSLGPSSMIIQHQKKKNENWKICRLIDGNHEDRKIKRQAKSTMLLTSVHFTYWSYDCSDFQLFSVLYRNCNCCNSLSTSAYTVSRWPFLATHNRHSPKTTLLSRSWLFLQAAYPKQLRTRLSHKKLSLHSSSNSSATGIFVLLSIGFTAFCAILTSQMCQFCTDFFVWASLFLSPVETLGKRASSIASCVSI